MTAMITHQSYMTQHSSLFTLISKAGSSKCGAQCMTYARNPFEQLFYDVILLSQSCYDLYEKMACMNINIVGGHVSPSYVHVYD